MAADMVFRLKFGLMTGADVPPGWDDIVIAAKSGFMAARADRIKGAGKGGAGGAQAVKPASQNERRAAIEAAQAEMRRRERGGG